MFRPTQLLLLLLLPLYWACSAESKYSYAIKDFRKPLQPYLTGIVSKGIVLYNDSALQHMATDKELMQLGQSEHPVLRASAFREMLRRKSFDHFSILMNHLDDTAIVATDAGEWGIRYSAVSDDIIQHAAWKDTAEKNKTIDRVLTRHNYLWSAYSILAKIQPQEKYYPYIKDMALRERKSVDDYNGQKTGDIEFALYGLAGFRKKEDTRMIKDLLLSNTWTMGELSFSLLKKFPDTAWMEVFETYYRKHFYRQICSSNSVSNAVSFVKTIAPYKNERSAAILASILNRKPFVNCAADTGWLKDNLILAIRDNPCAAYLKLNRQIAWQIREYEKNTITLPPFTIDLPAAIEPEKITW